MRTCHFKVWRVLLKNISYTAHWYKKASHTFFLNITQHTPKLMVPDWFSPKNIYIIYYMFFVVLIFGIYLAGSLLYSSWLGEITLVNTKNVKAYKFHTSLILGRWFRIRYWFFSITSEFRSIASFMVARSINQFFAFCEKTIRDIENLNT